MDKLEQLQQLEPLARKYIWWKSPSDALLMPAHVIAQVMNLGDYEDVQSMLTWLTQSELRQVIANAGAGQFNARSWTYWHYRLGMALAGQVPPLPTRRFA